MLHVDELLAPEAEEADVWQAAPGLVGMRGETFAAWREIESHIAGACSSLAADEWMVPAALALETLERASYFTSFPQWLTLASHLTDDELALERLAGSRSPTTTLSSVTTPPAAALPPAVCYHVYAALAGRRLNEAHYVSAQGTCWRHERERLAPLERGWAFTMREAVCIGTETDCATFVRRGTSIAARLAAAMGLSYEIVLAEDPFFAPTSRGRGLLQRVKSLKHELRLDIGGGRRIAAASFNLHERFFGEAFDIFVAGEPAHTACVAFGLERWLLAMLRRRQCEARR